MIRILLALAAGIAVAIGLIMLVEFIGNQLFPPPVGYDLNAGSNESLPTQTLIWPVLGWFAGALAGAWLAVRVSGLTWTSWAVAGFVLAGTIFNFILIRHPVWMMVAGILAPLAGAWLGQRLAPRNAAVSE